LTSVPPQAWNSIAIATLPLVSLKSQANMTDHATSQGMSPAAADPRE
jgi:hypothetical protein